MRLLPLVSPLALLAMSACTPTSVEQVMVPGLNVSYEATFDSMLPREGHYTRQTSQVVMVPGEGFEFTLPDLPDAAFDLGQIGTGQRLDLHVNLTAAPLESGEIRYAVRLTTQPVGGGDASLLAEPSLVVADGETATVHLGQDGGEFHTSFTLDLTGARVQ
ncbi:hypothetical protein [uncultured Maricaulis sp.]|uniref:hypothetical protein n=1 Tax=uncultured Maricaulis sp. TaxID=174710 RepID=UPI0030DC0455